MSLLALVFSSMPVLALEQNNEETFSISVKDELGNPVSNAAISLYSFLDGNCVINDTLDESGNCIISYKPSIQTDNLSTKSIAQGSTGDIVYGDYIVYVAKEGFETATHYVTKTYSPSGAHDFSLSNNESIDITLRPQLASNLSSQNATTESLYSMRVSNYLESTGKVNTSNPVYVLTVEDKAALVRRGITPDPLSRAAPKPLTNIQVPIGQFHVSSNCSLAVTFKSSDELRVQSATDSGLGFKISGSTARAFGSVSEYAPFSGAFGALGTKKTFYTRANFVDDETVILGGVLRTTRRLDRIHGGTEVGRPSSCSTCMKPYSSVMNGFGNATTIVPNSSVTQFRNKTSDINASADVAGVELGVTRITGSETEMKYTPSGYKSVRIYDMNYSYGTWHATHS